MAQFLCVCEDFKMETLNQELFKCRSLSSGLKSCPALQTFWFVRFLQLTVVKFFNIIIWRCSKDGNSIKNVFAGREELVSPD